MSRFLFSNDDSRRFRLHLLSMCVAGELSLMKSWDDVCEESLCTWYAAGGAFRNINMTVAENIQHKLWYDAWFFVNGFSFSNTKRLVKNGETPHDIAYYNCLSVIADHKKIDNAIDKLGKKIPSTQMSVEEVIKMCTMLMTFDDFEKIKLTIPLKMANYLIGYELLISFLYDVDIIQYHLLMKKHSRLVSDWGLENYYAKLTVPKANTTMLLNFLPTFPMTLIEIIVGYSYLCLNNSQDLDEIYDRLLKHVSAANHG